MVLHDLWIIGVEGFSGGGVSFWGFVSRGCCGDEAADLECRQKSELRDSLNFGEVKNIRN